MGFLERHPLLPAAREGIAISTFGKVIKRGWDWLGLTPPARAHIGGLIEVPDLAACLTLSKNDFIRTGAAGASYLAYRKAIQEVLSRQLAAWGDAGEADARPRTARLERDLERVLEDLADDFPLLESLVNRRAGGQKKLPMPGRGKEQLRAPLFSNLTIGEDLPGDSALPRADGASPAEPQGAAPPAQPLPTRSVEEPPTEEQPPATETPIDGAAPDAERATAAAISIDTVTGRRRPARYGLQVQFESRPDDAELARLVDSTVWINDAHPAFVRASASRSLAYHTALAVVLALAPLAVQPHEEHSFINQFLAHWGSAHSGARRHPGRRGKKTA